MPGSESGSSSGQEFKKTVPPKNEASDRNPDWKPWYPTVSPDFSKQEPGRSPYGEPNQETLNLFTNLQKGANILDVGGGDGRYALPLAQRGYNVTVLDVDIPHLERLNVNAQNVLTKGAGKIESFLADATEEYPDQVRQTQFDAVLTAGFAYLIPPDELKPVFTRMAEAVKPGGLLIVEFATNRDRRDPEGNSLIGKEEYNYTHEEGTETLNELYKESGLNPQPREKTVIHFETPYYMHTDLIISHGTKPDPTSWVTNKYS